MQIKLYEEKKKDGQVGRILIIFDEPSTDLAGFVKNFVGGLGGTSKSIDTTNPDKASEALPSIPETKPVAEAEVEELFADAPEPAPKAKAPEKPAPASKPAPAPAQQKPAAAPPKEAPKPAPAPKPEPKPAPKQETPAENNVKAEIEELWEMLDEDSKEEALANFGVGTFEDVEEDELPTLLDMLKGTLGL